MTTTRSFLLSLFLCGCLTFLPVTPFSASCASTSRRVTRPAAAASSLAASSSGEDDVSRQLAKARELIEKTKTKLESSAAASDAATASESSEGAEELPFFAQEGSDDADATKRREMLTKSKDDETGLITTDGEKMASLAEGEKWEKRSLFEVFENEREEAEANTAKDLRANRDVAASMMGLRKRMQTKDYEKIFDKRNRFIGDE